MITTTDKLNGTVKQAIGKVTDNKSLQAKGKAQEIKGGIKSTLKDHGEKLADGIEEATTR
jgi:uncharacterized protein YjbJ (UPF0337 family)